MILLGLGRINMWKYIKKLEYPINIQKKNLKMAKQLLAQYGGLNGELSASIQYLNQSFTMPDDMGRALLTDIGTEEIAHVEMISTMVSQLIKDASLKELEENDLLCHYTLHDHIVLGILVLIHLMLVFHQLN